MITRKEGILWILYAGLLVLLFLLSSTDLIIKERKVEVYPVSVIIEDANDDNYVNFRKGMDQAAIELNADVSFITLYEKGDAQQQMEMIAREQQDGIRALVVSPAQEQALSRALEENRITVPLVLLNSELTGDRVSARITADYHALGQELARRVMEEQPAELPVYLYSGEKMSVASSQFGDSIRAELGAAGYETVLVQKKGERDFREKIEELVYPGSGGVVIIALDPQSLRETADILYDSSVYASCVRGLYGHGNSVSVLNYLDKGIITGLCVTDSFSGGYLSVRKAVEAITKGSSHDVISLNGYYIEKEDLKNGKYEKMLYPVE